MTIDHKKLDILLDNAATLLGREVEYINHSVMMIDKTEVVTLVLKDKCPDCETTVTEVTTTHALLAVDGHIRHMDVIYNEIRSKVNGPPTDTVPIFKEDNAGQA